MFRLSRNCCKVYNGRNVKACVVNQWKGRPLKEEKGCFFKEVRNGCVLKDVEVCAVKDLKDSIVKEVNSSVVKGVKDIIVTEVKQCMLEEVKESILDDMKKSIKEVNDVMFRDWKVAIVQDLKDSIKDLNVSMSKELKEFILNEKSPMLKENSTSAEGKSKLRALAFKLFKFVTLPLVGTRLLSDIASAITESPDHAMIVVGAIFGVLSYIGWAIMTVINLGDNQVDEDLEAEIIECCVMLDFPF